MPLVFGNLLNGPLYCVVTLFYTLDLCSCLLLYQPVLQSLTSCVDIMISSDKLLSVEIKTLVTGGFVQWQGECHVR